MRPLISARKAMKLIMHAQAERHSAKTLRRTARGTVRRNPLLALHLGANSISARLMAGKRIRDAAKVLPLLSTREQKKRIIAEAKDAANGHCKGSIEPA